MTLHFYLAKRFLWTFLGVFAVFFVLIALIDLVEELRNFDELPLASVLEIVLLKAPQSNYEILPLVVLLSSVALFLRLARSSELVVIRAAGRSALRSLMAPVAVAAAIGVTAVSVFNPLVAASSKRHSEIVESYTGDSESVLAISPEGLWLRQGTARGQTVIHANRASPDVRTLYDTTFIAFSPDGTPLRRISAETARLGRGEWVLENAKLWHLDVGSNPESSARIFPTLSVPSALTQERIIDSFGVPEYISIWDLPAFVGQLEQAGFSARRYAVWYQMELARPLFLIALVVAASAFTMRHSRLGKTGVFVLTAVLLGFSLHYIRNFAQIMGENGQIPVMLAAWAPPVASLLLAVGILLQMEDG